MIWELLNTPKTGGKHLRSKRTTLLSAVYGESRVVLFYFAEYKYGLCSDAVVALVRCAFVNDILESDAA